MKKNPFSVLGVPDTASDEQIRNAYRELARKYSDSVGTTAKCRSSTTHMTR